MRKKLLAYCVASLAALPATAQAMDCSSFKDAGKYSLEQNADRIYAEIHGELKSERWRAVPTRDYEGYVSGIAFFSENSISIVEQNPETDSGPMPTEPHFWIYYPLGNIEVKSRFESRMGKLRASYVRIDYNTECPRIGNSKLINYGYTGRLKDPSKPVNNFYVHYPNPTEKLENLINYLFGMSLGFLGDIIDYDPTPDRIRGNMEFDKKHPLARE